jgi:hypothetical protein
MSSTYAEPLDRLHRVLDELAAISPAFRTTGDRQDFLLGVARAKARIAAEELRVLAASDDIAEETGDRSTATWLARQTREAHAAVRRHAALATALDSRWTQTAEAMGAGDVNLAQARVIVESLAALPKDLGDDQLVKAEVFLVAQAQELGPWELRNLGHGVLEHLAPEVAEKAEYQRLLREEQAATAATRLTMRRRGDGATDINARVPDAAAARLTAFLNAYTAPRRRHDNGLPIDRLRGEGFVALMENIPTDALPRHGGVATTVMVVLDYETLLSGVGVTTTSTNDRMTAGQARRLACQAGIIPVVLGGTSEILDLGRTRRLVSDAIRKALNLRDGGCTATNCTMPVEFCEAHHVVPWSRGGKTSLDDTKLLCSFHHHRAHDPAWLVHHQPNGQTSFTRRT